MHSGNDRPSSGRAKSRQYTDEELLRALIVAVITRDLSTFRPRRACNAFFEQLPKKKRIHSASAALWLHCERVPIDDAGRVYVFEGNDCCVVSIAGARFLGTCDAYDQNDDCGHCGAVRIQRLFDETKANAQS